MKAPERLVYTWDWEKDGSGTEFGEVEGKTSLITVEFLKRGDANGVRADAQPVRHGGEPGQSRAGMGQNCREFCELC